VLNDSLLEEFNRADGPVEGMVWWERWWEACNCVGVRLEDCMGALLGELPQDLPESDSKDEEDEDGKDEENKGEGGSGRLVFHCCSLGVECRLMSCSSCWGSVAR
jgi:hypothetical protein